MKKYIAKLLWIGIVIISILLVLLAVGKHIYIVAQYYSFPKTQARVLSVHNYQRRSETQEMKYGSRIHLQYTVNGKQIQGWLEYKTDSIIEVGEIITIAYNPDNPTQCKYMKFDIIKIMAFVAAVLYVAWMCRKIFKSPKK